jgi:hypothetical protein
VAICIVWEVEVVISENLLNLAHAEVRFQVLMAANMKMTASWGIVM